MLGWLSESGPISLCLFSSSPWLISPLQVYHLFSAFACFCSPSCSLSSFGSLSLSPLSLRLHLTLAPSPLHPMTTTTSTPVLVCLLFLSRGHWETPLIDIAPDRGNLEIIPMVHLWEVLSWQCFVCTWERQFFLNKYIHSQQSKHLYFHWSITTLSEYKPSLGPGGELQNEPAALGQVVGVGGGGQGVEILPKGGARPCAPRTWKRGQFVEGQRLLLLEETEEASGCPSVISSVTTYSWLPPPPLQRGDSSLSLSPLHSVWMASAAPELWRIPLPLLVVNLEEANMSSSTLHSQCEVWFVSCLAEPVSNEMLTRQG